MIRRKGLLLALTSSLVLGATTASAEVLAEYNFESGSTAASVSATYMNAGSVFIGSFDNDNNDSDGGPKIDAGLGLFTVRSEDTKTTENGTLALSDAIDSGDYIGFTLSSSNFTISQISFDYITISTFPTAFAAHVYIDENNFVGVTTLDPQLIENGGDAFSITNRSQDGTISDNVEVFGIGDSELTGLTGTVGIRIYLSDATAENGHFSRIDNIVIQGTPEPGSLALLALGGLCLTWRRRRD